MQIFSHQSSRPMWSFLLAGALLLQLYVGVLYADEIRFDYVEHLSTEDGLAHSTVLATHQDRRGFLWVATASALNRYDGYEFKAYRHDPKDPDSISGSLVMILLEDQGGDLWFGTRSSGLNRFDPAAERFEHFKNDPEDPRSLLGKRIISLFQDSEGTLWVGTEKGLNKFDQDTESFTRYSHDAAEDNSLRPGPVHALLRDRQGFLWIGTRTGLDRFDPKTEQFIHYDHAPPTRHGIPSLYESRNGSLWVGTPKGLYRLEGESGHEAAVLFSPQTNIEGSSRTTSDAGAALAEATIEKITEDRAGRLWISTDQGLFQFEPDAPENLVQYRHDPENPHSLSSHEVFHLHEDRSGILWISTRTGLNKFNPRREQFRTLRPHFLGGRQISAITTDQAGLLWIGTVEGNLVTLDPTRETKITHDIPGLPQKRVSALLSDQAGELWIGTAGLGLSRVDRERRNVTTYRHDPDDPNSLSEDGIFCLLEDSKRNLWVGTFGQGLQRMDPSREVFTSFRHDPSNPQGISSNDIYKIYEGRSDDLWIATYGGLNRLALGEKIDSTSAFTQYRHDSKNPNSLSSDKVTSIYEDESGILWIGTSGSGLNRFDPASGKFRSYWRRDGLADDKVVGLLSGHQEDLWISTSAGLSHLDLATETFRNYDVEDGLHGNVFLIRPVFRSPEGEIFFGGNDGLTSFFPEQISDAPGLPPVTLTDFRLLNEPVPLRRHSPSSPLQQSITATEDLELTHHHKIVSFEFAALHFASPRKNRYAYRLEGFDDDWIEADAAQRFAQYTNLDAGRYVFRVKASNQDGVWNEEGVAVRVRVLPPPWKTWWASCLYVLLFGAATWSYVRSHRKELERERETVKRERQAAEREREAAAKERDISQRLREVDQLKDEFLANTSHELQTPLYGITGLAESMIDDAANELPESVRSNLSMIAASGRRLGHLVGDLLDFSKLRHEGLELQLHEVDLYTLVEVVLTLCRSLADAEGLILGNAVPKDLPPVYADENRLQQVLYDLIGNAVKFTEEGTVTVSATVTEIDGDEQVMIQVRDTGIGIPQDQQQLIFKAFHQADASTEREYAGTGLGLTIAQQLVELHGGLIRVESSTDKSSADRGSTFYFNLPIAEKTVEVASLSATTDLPPSTPLPSPETMHGEGLKALVPGPGKRQKAHILAVDDDPVNRQVLQSFLSTEHFHLETASGGEQAIQLIRERNFDLVLLDVMMPKVSGYEVCRAAREIHPIADLPILFLTAKSLTTDVEVGLSLGANDYLTKPIAKGELLARMRPHLDLLKVHRSLEGLVSEKMSQIKVLEGILPTCCSCKRIRDENGTWSQMESYIDRHSEAKFSHGFCPDCLHQFHAGDN